MLCRGGILCETISQITDPEEKMESGGAEVVLRREPVGCREKLAITGDVVMLIAPKSKNSTSKIHKTNKPTDKIGKTRQGKMECTRKHQKIRKADQHYTKQISKHNLKREPGNQDNKKKTRRLNNGETRKRNTRGGVWWFVEEFALCCF